MRFRHPAMDRKETRDSRSAIRKWVGTASFYIYINFFLGAWGDRMWTFSVGLYLVTLNNGLLRLAATFGLCMGISVLLFGGIIGAWVDRNPRLKVVKIVLFLQNISVMLSALAVCVSLKYQEKIETLWDGGLKVMCEACIVTLAVIAALASVAHKIAIEKDWIVEVAGGKKSRLANLNAVIRAVDLGCLVLAPTVSGFIMKFASLVVSALVIALWNLVSVFVEYGLLYKVYHMVPALAKKGGTKTVENGVRDVAPEERELMAVAPDRRPQSKTITNLTSMDTSLKASMKEGLNRSIHDLDSSKNMAATSHMIIHEEKSLIRMIMKPFITFGKSWKIYSRQKVVFAGLSLSFLYLTVLGFDSITVGYIYANGVDESMNGLSMAVAGLTGILGTLLFTRCRPKIGLEKTGFLAFTIELLCQSVCLASVFAPGTPFKPFNPEIGHHCTPNFNISLLENDTFDNRDHNVVKRHVLPQSSQFAEYPDVHGMAPSTYSHVNDLTHIRLDIQSVHVLKKRSAGNQTSEKVTVSVSLQATAPGAFLSLQDSANNTTVETGTSMYDVTQTRKPLSINKTEHYIEQPRENATDCPEKWRHNGPTVSVILLIIGLVTSRTGLWMADLTITQLLQETVAEQERGTVGGVQNSLNMLMDLTKFALVIFVPHVETFGYLVMVSVFSCFTAACLFLYHAYKTRGFLCCCTSDKGISGDEVDIQNSSDKTNSGNTALPPSPNSDVGKNLTDGLTS